MNYIVTGGAGFIGSHLVESLLEQGHSVTVVDNFTTGSQSNLPKHVNLKVTPKAIEDCVTTDFVLPIHGIAHLAATPSVNDSWLYPIDSHHNNLSTTVRVLSLCQSLKINRVVFASSAAVYGNEIKLPISEEQVTDPISPYGLQKLVSEQYGKLFAQQFNLTFVALRLFNVFGPRQSPKSPYSGVISIFSQAMARRSPITIYGDGLQTRDFVYVQDVAAAFSQALTQVLPAKTFLACNIGTGQRTSLLDIIRTLKDFYPDWQAGIQSTEARLGDIRHSQADISKAQSILGFAPQCSVRSGLRALVDSLEIDEFEYAS
jgi:UDP-glucose 4-epimerase